MTSRKLVGCDKQRAGTPNGCRGVPALSLVTPYEFTNWRAVGALSLCRTPVAQACAVFKGML